MQEEIEKKTCKLAVRISVAASKALLQELSKEYANIKVYLKQKMAQGPKGKQTVKQLVGQGQGVSSMEIGDAGFRDFNKIAKKYGVDFAIVKDKDVNPPKYTCFFKAKDADAILKVIDEYTKKQVKKKDRTENRSSVLEKLKHFKEIVAKTPRKSKEKRKEQSR